MNPDSFSQRVYAITSLIPEGKVSTYKQIAQQLKTKAYRAVGTALKKNPNAPKVPCHRVICSNGAVGKYALGVENKIKLLKAEGVHIKNNTIDLKKYGFSKQ